MIDHKDWTQNRADNIAIEQYGRDFYELDGDDQVAVYEQAEEDYKDWYSSKIDAIYERAKEAKILQENGY